MAGGVGVAGGVAVPQPQTLKGDAVLRGLGEPTVKSAPLLSVSIQPAPLRRSAVVARRPPAAVRPPGGDSGAEIR